MKDKTVFYCSACGWESSKWVGKCLACGEWNTMVEQRVSKAQKASSKRIVKQDITLPKKLSEIVITKEERFSTGIGEFDRVLGGGIVKGSLILVGGAPGIGKSTLLLQMCGSINTDKTILYVSAEESQKQIRIRADRLGINCENLLLFAQTDLDEIEEIIHQINPSMVIIDSVQTVYRPDFASAPGSVGQVREVTMTCMKLAKETGISVFLVGHVTKDGNLAGPRVLEHMVDTVLYFEGEEHNYHRILRGIKNRFGSTNEIGVFEMRDKGLIEVTNPSMLMLSDKPEDASGSCVICSMEGTRPMLTEIQALVTRTNYPVPKRMSAGIDYNRVSLIMAVLEKRLKINLSTQDAYINVVGGIKIVEPAADIGIALSVISSYKNKPLPKSLVAFGEIGLTGEIRSVNFVDQRIKEAIKLGFKQIVVPFGNKTSLKLPSDIKVNYVSNVADCLSLI